MSETKNIKKNDAFGFGSESDQEMDDGIQEEPKEVDEEESAFGFNFASAPDKKVFDPSKSAKRTPGAVGKAKPSSK